MTPEWKQLAKELEGVIRIGVVNCEDDWLLCKQQQISSLPSLILYPNVNTKTLKIYIQIYNIFIFNTLLERKILRSTKC